MKNYKIIFSVLQCIANGIEFTMSSFKDDLSQNYGEKHFITERGEIAIINFLQDRIPDTFNEINEFIELAWNKVQVNKESEMLSSLKQDAWRFFADFSPTGNIWYSEVMYQNSACLSVALNNAKLLSETEIDSIPAKLEYTRWNSLTDNEKSNYSEWFVLHPVCGSYAIINSPFHNISFTQSSL